MSLDEIFVLQIVWPMQFTLNRRLLRNNCVFFLVTFFILEFIHLSFFKTKEPVFSIKPIDLETNFRIEIQPTEVKTFSYLFPRQFTVSCPSLYESDPNELKHALALISDLSTGSALPDDVYNITLNQCSAYRQARYNETFHVSDTNSNRQFSLAFSILMFENVEQFERLLRLIYRPQNFYCVHVDKDASEKVFKAVQSIVQCFNNVIMASQRERVLYATFSRLQADLNCMVDLLKYPSWKYLLNFANTELPLKTNSELVKILSIYRGYNDIEGRWKSKNVHRTEYVWQILSNISSSNSQGPFIIRTAEKKKTPPGNVEIVKGSAYGLCRINLLNHLEKYFFSLSGAFSRAFIEFVHTSQIAKELLDWSRDTYSPDEHYWATLNYNTHLRAPGGHKGLKKINEIRSRTTFFLFSKK